MDAYGNPDYAGEASGNSYFSSFSPTGQSDPYNQELFPTYQNPSGGSDAIKAAGGAASSLVGLFFGNKQLQDQKKMTATQRQQYIEQYQSAMKDSSKGELDVLRTGTRAANEQRAAFGARGMGDSSAAEQGQQDLAYTQNSQIDSLRRQRALMTSGYDAQTKIWALQDNSRALGQASSLLQSGIGTAMSLALLLL